MARSDDFSQVDDPSEKSTFYRLARILIAAGREVPRLSGTGMFTRSICDYPPDGRSQALLLAVAEEFSEISKGGSLVGSVADLVPWLAHARAFDESFSTAGLAGAGWSDEKIRELLEWNEHLDEREELCRREYAVELEHTLAPRDIVGCAPIFFAPRGMFHFPRDEADGENGNGESDEEKNTGVSLQLGERFTLERNGDWYSLRHTARASFPSKFVTKLTEAAEAMLGALYALDVVKLDDAGFQKRLEPEVAPPAAVLPEAWELPASLRLATRWSIAVEPDKDLSEFQRRTLERIGVQGIQIERRHLDGLRNLFEQGEFSKVVRQGSRFYYRAVTSSGPGELYSNCGVCLEALLLGSKHPGVQARLAEAVAHILGPDTPRVMMERRNWVRDLYAWRSEWVHQGRESFGIENELQALALTGDLVKLHLMKLGVRAGDSS